MFAGSGARHSEMACFGLRVRELLGLWKYLQRESPEELLHMCEIYNLLLALGILSLTSYQNTPLQLCTVQPANPILAEHGAAHSPDGFHTFSSELRPVSGLCRHWLGRGQDDSPAVCLTASRLLLRWGCGQLSSAAHESFSTATVQKKIKNERPANSIYLMSQNQFHFGFLALSCALYKHCGQTEVQ